ncbi:thiamine diphosphokinase [Amaricoccus sp.]|uniref:thiamine diphosphokinase n=1 Tax=Amaricoccus sp. TaxID=1872485 RepID=UPI0025C125DF|nr:thiamine diphosphokinase [Amaricoccus sp.]
MSAPLVSSDAPVTLVGGGPVDPAQLAQALALAPLAVAADGGGDLALPGGRDFAAVIGDMDSVRDLAALAARGVAIHPSDDQDTTDLEKCLAAIRAPLVLGLGFLHGRIDHQLAAMNALVRWPAPPAILIGGEDLAFRCPPRLALDLPAGMRVSLFPMAPATGLACEGLRWTVAGRTLAPDARIGTSNEATGGPLRLAFDGPAMLVILPVETLPRVIDCLLAELP